MASCPLTDEGIDFTFINWRGVLAPPGISDATREEFIDLLTQMHDTPQWREALKRNGWTDDFVTGDDFGTFLAEQNYRVASTLKELGLV